MRGAKALGNLLRAGVTLAVLVVLAGGALYLARHGGEHMTLHVFHGEPADLRTIGGIWAGLGSGSARAIIQFGLLLLIATPVARVIGAAAVFARDRDWLYMGIAGVVLALLTYSLMFGAGS